MSPASMPRSVPLCACTRVADRTAKIGIARLIRMSFPDWRGLLSWCRTAGSGLKPLDDFGWQIDGAQLSVFLLGADGRHAAGSHQRVTGRDGEGVADGSSRQLRDA